MAAGDLITADYQMEFNGLLVGDDNFEIISWDGLGLPDVRSSDVNRPQADGQFAGTDYLSGRTFSLQLEMWHDNATQFGSRIASLTTSFKPGSEHDFVVQVPSIGKVYSTCKVRRRSGPTFDLAAAIGMVVATIELHAVDPRWYAVTAQQDTATITAATGGVSFPVSFPLTFVEVSAGSIIATNSGVYEAFPTITITGPITNPSLENVSSGKILAFTGTVLSGETLVIDFLNRTALLNGVSSRYNWIDDSQQWWSLAPGASEIKLNGTGGSGATDALVEWRSAWV